MDKPVLDTCLDPVKVYVGGKIGFRHFPCGYCIACKRHKISVWRNRLYRHMSNPDYYCVFITLTYDNENLPLVELDCSCDYPLFKSFSRSKLRRINSHDQTPYRVSFELDNPTEFNSFISRARGDELFIPHFVKFRSGDVKIFDEKSRFAVCLKKDIQDFIKRLRTNIDRTFDPLQDLRVTYFICSEYGPSTFRPHYHGVLFFRDPNIAQWAVDCGVFNSWRKQSLPENAYGDKIASLIVNSAASASYVSKYVTCFDSLPYLLNYPEFAPFHLQSTSCPIGSEVYDLADVPNLLENRHFSDHVTYYDSEQNKEISYELPLPSCFWRKVFPTFLCDGLLDDTTRLRLLRRIYNFKSPDDFPDYRKTLELKYGLNQYTTNVVYQSIPIDYISRLWQSVYNKAFPDRPSRNNLGFFHLPLYNVELIKKTPSDVARNFLCCLGGLIDNIDYYLFGIEQNRCAAKKLWKLMHHSFCGHSVTEYHRLRLQYLSSVFSLSYARLVEFVNYHSTYFDTDLVNQYVYEPDLQPFTYFDELSLQFSFLQSCRVNSFSVKRKYLHDNRLQL